MVISPTLDFSRAISSSRSQDTIKPRQSAFWDLSEAKPICSLHSTNNKAPLKGGAKLTVRGSGLPTLASRIE